MKTNFGHFAIDLGDGEWQHVTPLLLDSPEWNGVSPDRRAYMVLVANTRFGLMRLSDPVLVQDHENVTDAEVEKMLGVYGKYNKVEIDYRDFLKLN